MERLTERITENQIELSAKVNKPQHYSPIIHIEHPFWTAFNKLAEYEQAEEDGLLHKAPIPNGTIIYLWAENDDDEMIIHSESYLYGVTEFLYGKFGEDFWDSEEQALAKMKGE